MSKEFCRKALVLIQIIIPTILATIQFAIPFACAEEEKYSLTYEFKKGVEAVYLQSSYMKMNMTVRGLDTKSTMASEQIISQKILDIYQDGSARIKMTYGPIRGLSQMPMYGELAFDSRDRIDKKGNQAVQARKSFKKAMSFRAGSVSEMRIDSKGNVTEFKLLRTGLEDLDETEKMIIQSRNMDASMEKGIKNWFQVLPDTMVGLGDEWESKELMDPSQMDVTGMGMSVESNDTKVLRARNEKSTVIEIDGIAVHDPLSDHESSILDQLSNILGGQIEVNKYSGLSSGRYEFSSQDGLVNKTTSKSTFSISVGADAKIIYTTEMVSAAKTERVSNGFKLSKGKFDVNALKTRIAGDEFEKESDEPKDPKQYKASLFERVIAKQLGFHEMGIVLTDKQVKESLAMLMISPDWEDDKYLYVAMGELDSEQLEEALDAVKKSPRDPELRAVLMGNFARKSTSDAKAIPKYEEQMKWFIENMPDSAASRNILMTTPLMVHADLYERVKKLWLKQVRRRSRNPNVLGNAGIVFAVRRRAEGQNLAEKYLLKAIDKDPQNKVWHQELAKIYEAQARKSKDSAKANVIYEKALGRYEAMLELDSLALHLKVSTQLLAAKAAWNSGKQEKAGVYAKSVLELDKKNMAGRFQNISHDAHVVLGQLAIEQGEVEASLGQLSLAVAKPNEQIGFMGTPDFALAELLFDKGHKNEVVDYLTKMKKLWTHGELKIQEWVKEIEAGKTPDFTHTHVSSSAIEKTYKGKMADNFELKDLDGNTVKLSEYRGKVVVLDFWATWCKPCISAMPSMQSVWAAADKERVQFFLISTDPEKRERIDELVKEKGLTMPILLDDQGVNDTYEVDSIPRTFIIDTEGIIRHVHVGFSGDLEITLRKEIKSLLAGVDGSKSLGEFRDEIVPERGLEKALEEARRLAKANPDEPEAWSALSGLLHDAGKSKEAVEVASKAVDLPDGHTRSDLWALEKVAESAGDHVVHIKILNLIQKMYEITPAWRDKMASSLLGLGRNEEALQVAKKAVKADPKNFHSHLLLGNVLFKTGLQKKGIRSVKKALKLNPDDRGAQGLLRHMMEQEKSRSKNRKSGKKANQLKSDPRGRIAVPKAVMVPGRKNASQFLRLATAFESQDRHEEASQALIEASKINDKDSEIIQRMSASARRLRNSALIVRRLETISRKNRKFAYVHQILGSMHHGAGRYEKALKYRRMRQKLEPGNAEAMVDLAHSYIDLGREKDAKRVHKKLANLSRKDAIRVERMLYTSSLRKRGFQETIRDLENRISAGEKNTVMKEALVEAYRQAGQMEKALDLATDIGQANNKNGVENWIEVYTKISYQDHAGALEAIGKIEKVPGLSKHPIARAKGKALVGLGKTDEAVKALEAGVQAWPSELYAQIELSNALYRLGRDKEAASVLETATKSGGKITWFLYQPAMTHFQQGRVDACDRLVPRMPLTDTYWGMMQGFILIEKGLLKEAQKFFEGYLDYQGEYAQLLPGAYRALARVALYRGDLDKAEFMLSKALESAPEDVLGTHRIYTSVLGLARVKGDQKSFQKYVSKAIGYGDTTPWWDWETFGAAWLRISTGHPRVAEMHLRSAMLVSEYNAREARIMIEVLHFTTGKKHRARSNIENILSEISPEHVLLKAKAYLSLSYLDSKTGDNEQSQNNLKKAQDLVPGITADYLRAFDHLMQAGR